MNRKNIATLMLSLIIVLAHLIIPSYLNLTKSYDLGDLSDNFDILPDHNNGFFILDKNNNNIKYFYIENENLITKSICDNITYISAKVVNSKLYILKNNNLNYPTIFKYELYNNNVKTTIMSSLFSIYSNTYNGDNIYYNSFTVDANENIYFINSENKLCSVGTDDSYTELHSEYKITSITTNIAANKLYALTENKKILNFDLSAGPSTNLYYEIIENYSDEYFYFLKENIIISYSGKVYIINEHNSVEEIFTSNSEWPAKTIETLDNYLLCKVSDKTINCYERDSSGKYVAIKNFESESKVLALSTSKNTCIAITDKNGTKSVKLLSINDFKDILNENSDNTIPIENNENIENTENNNQFNISSSLYKIDFQNHIITDVPISTTATVFKENIDYSECNISFKSYLGKNIVSGKLGTSSTVTFEKDGSTLTFKIIVSGDLTGEGNINSRDTNTLYDYLIGKSELLDEYLLASDLNGDGIVNTLDLLMISKIIKSQ